VVICWTLIKLSYLISLLATIDTTLRWVCPFTFVPSLSCIYASLQHFFIRWIDQYFIPPNDEQFSSGICSRAEKFYVDDDWAFYHPSSFVFKLGHHKPTLFYISATNVFLLSWVCPLLHLYFIAFLCDPILRLRGGVEIMECNLHLRPLTNLIYVYFRCLEFWLKSWHSQTL